VSCQKIRLQIWRYLVDFPLEFSSDSSKKHRANMANDEGMIPVLLEKLQSNSGGSGPRTRTHIGTEHFPVGTSANDVCTTIMEKQKASMGLWLLQVKVNDPENYPDVEDGCYVTIKDSKYQLEQGKLYFAVHFSGSGIVLNLT